MKGRIDERYLSDEDLKASATTHMVKQYNQLLGMVNGKIDSLLDIGCGFGGITQSIAATQKLDFDSVYGLDMEPSRLLEARRKGIRTLCVDMETGRIPLPDGSISLVLCNGVLEHMKFYDNLFQETYRVLRHNGYFLFVMPNMASWLNVISLIFGYQPHEVEISSHYAGTLFMRGQRGGTHIHTGTLRAMVDLVNWHGFFMVAKRKGNPDLMNPDYLKYNRIVKAINNLVPLEYSRRFMILARKP